MKIGLRAKAIAIYCLLVTVTLSVAYFGVDFAVKDTFGDYLERRIKEDQERIIDRLPDAFGESMGWGASQTAEIITDATKAGMSMTIFDMNGKVVATSMGNGKTGARMGRMMGMRRNPYVSLKTVVIVKNGINVGYAELSYQNLFLTEADSEFLIKVNRFLIASGISIAAFAIVIGIIFADSISKPILRVLTFTQSLGRGNLTARITNTDTTREISQLYKGMNDLAEEMGRQDLLRKRMAGDVAHELKTPITIAKARLEAMQDGILPNNRKELKLSISELERLSDMVHVLESISRIESGIDALRKGKCGIVQLVSSSVEAMQPLFIAKGVTIELIACADKEATLDCDKIRRALDNLLSNSLRYTDEGGRVRVSVSLLGSGISIEVDDSGTGIDAKDLPYVFDRFYRADESRNRGSGGMGIGLALVKSIIEAHGGSITAWSEPGKGSIFTIQLPLMES